MREKARNCKIFEEAKEILTVAIKKVKYRDRSGQRAGIDSPNGRGNDPLLCLGEKMGVRGELKTGNQKGEKRGLSENLRRDRKKSSEEREGGKKKIRDFDAKSR